MALRGLGGESEEADVEEEEGDLDEGEGGVPEDVDGDSCLHSGQCQFAEG